MAYSDFCCLWEEYFLPPLPPAPPHDVNQRNPIWNTKTPYFLYSIANYFQNCLRITYVRWKRAYLINTATYVITWVILTLIRLLSKVFTTHRTPQIICLSVTLYVVIKSLPFLTNCLCGNSLITNTMFRWHKSCGIKNGMEEFCRHFIDTIVVWLTRWFSIGEIVNDFAVRQ